MFFRPGEPHGLRHNPFNAIVVPRPIGWISSTGRHATDHGFKDSIANIEATKEFVVNMATWELREHMNRSSAPAPHGVDEFDLARVTAEPSRVVRPPRVKESPVHLECRHVRTVPLLSASAEEPNTLIVGEVVGIHIADAVIVDGMVDYARMQPIGRLGYQDYARLGEVFAMTRPSWP
jgi:flavin reductase (DIM6/NTAB) family NADH-FMN oxidoreductase RutF